MSDKQAFLARVQADAGLAEPAQAEQLTERVFKTLRGRMAPDEAAALEETLPVDLQVLWRKAIARAFASALTGTSSLSYDDFVVKIAEDYQVPHDQAGLMTRAVFRALKAEIGEAEAADLASRLPRTLKAAWLAA